MNVHYSANVLRLHSVGMAQCIRQHDACSLLVCLHHAPMGVERGSCLTHVGWQRMWSMAIRVLAGLRLALRAISAQRYVVCSRECIVCT